MSNKLIFIASLGQVVTTPWEKGSKSQSFTLPIPSDIVTGNFVSQDKADKSTIWAKVCEVVTDPAAQKALATNIKAQLGLKPTDVLSNKIWEAQLAQYQAICKAKKIINKQQMAAFTAVSWALMILEGTTNLELGADMTKEGGELWGEIENQISTAIEIAELEAQEQQLATDPTGEVTIQSIDGNALDLRLKAIEEAAEGMEQAFEGLTKMAKANKLHAIALRSETAALPAGKKQSAVIEEAIVEGL